MVLLLTLLLLAADCRSQSVTELFVELDSGGIFARRRAIEALSTAAPATAPEMERLLAAVRQGKRLRLKQAALAALDNTGESPTLDPFCGRMLKDDIEDIRMAGLKLCRKLGVPESDPRLSAFYQTYPQLLPRPAEEDERFRSWADRVQACAAGRVRGGLLEGKEAARGGKAALSKAEAMLSSEDPLEREVGLGIVLFMADPEAKPGLERIAKGKDEEAASCARDALKAMAGGKGG